MNTQDERQAFITWATRNQYDVSEIDTVYGVLFKRQSTENAWMGWISSAKAKDEKLEGCVVVPKDQIEVWWQDAEEPENFATQSKDLHFIADGLEDGDIMKIHEHHTIHMPSNTLYGAWIYKDRERIFITGTKTDVEAARGGNE